MIGDVLLQEFTRSQWMGQHLLLEGLHQLEGHLLPLGGLHLRWAVLDICRYGYPVEFS
jgi:hypothetical protein